MYKKNVNSVIHCTRTYTFVDIYAFPTPRSCSLDSLVHPKHILGRGGQSIEIHFKRREKKTHTHTHKHILLYIYIYIHIYIFVVSLKEKLKN